MALLCEVTICSLIVSVNGPKNFKCRCSAAVATSSSLLAQPSARPCGRGTFSQKSHFDRVWGGWERGRAGEGGHRLLLQHHILISISMFMGNEVVKWYIRIIFLGHPRENDPRGKHFKKWLDEFLGQSNCSLYSPSFKSASAFIRWTAIRMEEEL